MNIKLGFVIAFLAAIAAPPSAFAENKSAESASSIADSLGMILARADEFLEDEGTFGAGDIIDEWNEAFAQAKNVSHASLKGFADHFARIELKLRKTDLDRLMSELKKQSEGSDSGEVMRDTRELIASIEKALDAANKLQIMVSEHELMFASYASKALERYALFRLDAVEQYLAKAKDDKAATNGICPSVRLRAAETVIIAAQEQGIDVEPLRYRLKELESRVAAEAPPCDALSQNTH